MSLPNPGMTFDPFDPLPASQLNDVVENIEALANGTGLDDDAVTASKIVFGIGGAGWEEIARSADLVSPTDTITVTSIPARRNLLLLWVGISTGGTISSSIRFNNDSGTNYTDRYSTNGGADATTVSQTALDFRAGTAAWIPEMVTAEVLNIATSYKLVTHRAMGVTTGAGTAPSRLEGGGAWANNSAQINRIDIINAGTGDYAVGSQLVVLGRD